MTGYKDIDRHDILILSALGEDPRLPASALGELVHLSRTAVSRRLQAMKEAGVLTEHPQIVCFESVGLKTRAFVELYARDRSVDYIAESLLERAEVLRLSVVAGKALLILEVICVDLEHLSRFMKWLQTYGDTETKIVFRSKSSKMTLKERLHQFESLCR